MDVKQIVVGAVTFALGMWIYSVASKKLGA